MIYPSGGWVRSHSIRNRIRLEALYRILLVFRGKAKTKYQIDKETTEDKTTTNNYFKYMQRCGMLKTEYVIAHGERIPHYALSEKGLQFLELLEQIYNMLIVI